MAVAMASWSKVASSVRLPPPRMTTTTSRSRWRRERAHCRRVTSVTAHSPCTRTSTSRSWKRKRAALDLVEEVGPRGAGTAGDHTDAQRRRRHAAVRLLRSYSPAATRRRTTSSRCSASLAEREARVDAAHLQAQLAGRCEEVEVAEDAHLQPVGQAQPVLHQQRLQPSLRGREELHVDDGLALVGLLHQAEVGVRAAHAPALDLAAHPHAIAEPAAQARR